MNTPVREGETIEGSRTMRNRPYPVLKCSRNFQITIDPPGYDKTAASQLYFNNRGKPRPTFAHKSSWVARPSLHNEVRGLHSHPGAKGNNRLLYGATQPSS